MMAEKGIQGYSVDEWEKMEEEITTLRAQLAECKESRQGYYNEAAKGWEKFRQAERQLKKHGGHTADCKKHNTDEWDTVPLKMDWECTPDCGWAKIEKELG